MTRSYVNRGDKHMLKKTTAEVVIVQSRGINCEVLRDDSRPSLPIVLIALLKYTTR